MRGIRLPDPHLPHDGAEELELLDVSVTVSVEVAEVLRVNLLRGHVADHAVGLLLEMPIQLFDGCVDRVVNELVDQALRLGVLPGPVPLGLGDLAVLGVDIHHGELLRHHVAGRARELPEELNLLHRQRAAVVEVDVLHKRLLLRGRELQPVEAQPDRVALGVLRRDGILDDGPAPVGAHHLLLVGHLAQVVACGQHHGRAVGSPRVVLPERGRLARRRLGGQREGGEDLHRPGALPVTHELHCVTDGRGEEGPPFSPQSET
mmetsp:Transcript_115124/g.247442  ORF Transcript_115124/g.247442 Transcript_115124/m.247442 type:complete len:262 (+) Transcript_115124:782-1567(+)